MSNVPMNDDGQLDFFTTGLTELPLLCKVPLHLPDAGRSWSYTAFTIATSTSFVRVIVILREWSAAPRRPSAAGGGDNSPWSKIKIERTLTANLLVSAKQLLPANARAFRSPAPTGR